MRFVVSLLIMSHFLACLLVFYSLIAHADFDLNFEVNYRHYPQAASAASTIGYDYLFWGSSGDQLYGFTRVALTAEGITDYFSHTAMIEIFPVNILGVKFGKSWSANYKDYEAYNCIDYLCRGHFMTHFLEVPFFIEYSGLALVASWRSEQWQVTDPLAMSNRVEYVEPTSGLPLLITSQREIQRTRVAVLYKYDENWRVGVTEVQYLGERSGRGYKATYSRMRAVLTQFQMKGVMTSEGGLSLLFGVGEFSSKLALTDPTFFLNLSFSPWPK